MVPDPHGLARFVHAQEPVLEQVVAELSRGLKRSHWMWFVFPQLRGLGHSATATHFGIASADEALAYWRHPVLGPRLKAHTEHVLVHTGQSVQRIFGHPDDLKFQSSMTLFEQIAPDDAAFARALDRFYAGQRDDRTLALLSPRARS